MRQCAAAALAISDPASAVGAPSSTGMNAVQSTFGPAIHQWFPVLTSAVHSAEEWLSRRNGGVGPEPKATDAMPPRPRLALTHEDTVSMVIAAPPSFVAFTQIDRTPTLSRVPQTITLSLGCPARWAAAPKMPRIMATTTPSPSVGQPPSGAPLLVMKTSGFTAEDGP